MDLNRERETQRRYMYVHVHVHVWDTVADEDDKKTIRKRSDYKASSSVFKKRIL